MLWLPLEKSPIAIPGKNPSDANASTVTSLHAHIPVTSYIPMTANFQDVTISVRLNQQCQLLFERLS